MLTPLLLLLVLPREKARTLFEEPVATTGVIFGEICLMWILFG